jgi:hypothetical protein
MPIRQRGLLYARLSLFQASCLDNSFDCILLVAREDNDGNFHFFQPAVRNFAVAIGLIR